MHLCNISGLRYIFQDIPKDFSPHGSSPRGSPAPRIYNSLCRECVLSNACKLQITGRLLKTVPGGFSQPVKTYTCFVWLRGIKQLNLEGFCLYGRQRNIPGAASEDREKIGYGKHTETQGKRSEPSWAPSGPCASLP